MRKNEWFFVCFVLIINKILWQSNVQRSSDRCLIFFLFGYWMDEAVFSFRIQKIPIFKGQFVFIVSNVVNSWPSVTVRRGPPDQAESP